MLFAGDRIVGEPSGATKLYDNLAGSERCEFPRRPGRILVPQEPAHLAQARHEDIDRRHDRQNFGYVPLDIFLLRIKPD